MTTASASKPPTPTPPTAPLTRSERFITAAVFLFPALALTVPDGYSIGAVALLAAAISHRIAARDTWAQQPPLPTAVKAVIAFMILYALFWVGDAALRGEGIREFDRPSRFLLAAFCLSVFARARIQQGALWLGLAVGGIGAGGLAVWQKLIEGHSRANGFAQTIQFGNAAMLIGLMCLAGMIWVAHPPSGQPRAALQKTALGALLTAGALGGLSAAFLSGTRGAWLALIPAVLIGLWCAWQVERVRRYLIVAPIALALVMTTAYFTPTTGVERRVSATISETQDYLGGDHRARGVGARFEIWKGAWQLFSERPLLGWGELGYIERTDELAAAGVIAKRAGRFTHSHNEWLNALAKKGIAGALVLLGLYLAPVVAFTRSGLSHQSGRPVIAPGWLAVATAGMLFTLGFMATGMTQVNFNHNIGAMLYAFMIAVLVGLNGAPSAAKSA